MMSKEAARLRVNHKFVQAVRLHGTVEKALEVVKYQNPMKPPEEVQAIQEWQRGRIKEDMESDVIFSDKVQRAKEYYFLKRLRETQTTGIPCKELGISLAEAFDWAKKNVKFRNEWDKIGFEVEEMRSLELKHDIATDSIAVKKKVLKRGLADGATIEEMKLAQKDAGENLRGTGYLVERPLVEVKEDKRTINIERVEIVTKQGMRIEERLIEEGDKE